MSRTFKLPIGFEHEGQEIKEAVVADTGSEAEMIYTKKPSSSKVQTWFGKVIAISVESIGDTKVAGPYSKQEDKEDIPKVVLSIPFIDAGSLLVQIQRECWENDLGLQKLQCVNCGAILEGTMDLDKIEIPEGPKSPMLDFVVSLGKEYTIKDMPEPMKHFEGMKFNQIKFRTATLGDSIRHQEISEDQVLFWKKLAFDTIEELQYLAEDGMVTSVPSDYTGKRGMKFFNSDLHSKTLRKIRAGVQTIPPSATYFYEDKCTKCDKMTPFYASVAKFFLT